MNIEIQNEAVVVLHGPAMSGKTTLARESAVKRGSYTTVNLAEIQIEHFRQLLLSRRFLTWIIDEIPAKKRTLEKILNEIEKAKKSADNFFFPAIIICTTGRRPIDYLDPQRCSVIIMKEM